MNRHNNLTKITFSAMIIAVYVIIMYVSQWIAYGAIQVRIATSLYALPAIFPFLVLPLSFANALSNTLFGGLGIIDIVGGFIVGLLTTSSVYFIRKLQLNDWFIALPIIFIPGLIVPIWLAPILSAIPDMESVTYNFLAISITIGQVIPGIVGVLMVKEMKKRNLSFKNLSKNIE